MNRPDFRVGIPAGILAATATAGALIAIGARASTPVRPFNIIAGHLLGVQRADVYGFVPSVTLTGIALHIVLTTAMALAVAFVARRRFIPASFAALVITTLSALVSIGIARRGGSSLARLLAVGDLLLFYIVLAAALMIGIRLAFFGTPKDRSRRIDKM